MFYNLTMISGVKVGTRLGSGELTVDHREE
jgi:hypothetical protein